MPTVWIEQLRWYQILHLSLVFPVDKFPVLLPMLALITISWFNLNRFAEVPFFATLLSWIHSFVTCRFCQFTWRWSTSLESPNPRGYSQQEEEEWIWVIPRYVWRIDRWTAGKFGDCETLLPPVIGPFTHWMYHCSDKWIIEWKKSFKFSRRMTLFEKSSRFYLSSLPLRQTKGVTDCPWVG